MADRDPLDEFFEAARRTAPEPSAELLSRVARDAAAETVRRQAAQSRLRPVWRGVFDGLGGWPALAGLATATVAGVWIGVADPLNLDPLSLMGAGGFDTSALSSGYDDIAWGEG